jgi:lysozyme
MNIDNTIDLTKTIIKKYEGLKLNAYRCPRGILTIGWGHTMGVKEGDVCTQDQAEAYLTWDIKNAIEVIMKLSKVELSDGQMGALISFEFNEGQGNFASSSLLKFINNGDFSSASKEFRKWNKTHINGVLTVLDGLTRRREDERVMFVG